MRAPYVILIFSTILALSVPAHTTTSCAEDFRSVYSQNHALGTMKGFLAERVPTLDGRNTGNEWKDVEIYTFQEKYRSPQYFGIGYWLKMGIKHDSDNVYIVIELDKYFTNISDWGYFGNPSIFLRLANSTNTNVFNIPLLFSPSSQWGNNSPSALVGWLGGTITSPMNTGGVYYRNLTGTGGYLFEILLPKQNNWIGNISDDLYFNLEYYMRTNEDAQEGLYLVGSENPSEFVRIQLLSQQKGKYTIEPDVSLSNQIFALTFIIVFMSGVIISMIKKSRIKKGD